MRIVSYVTVVSVQERIARRWVRGAGKDAEFVEDSEGFYAKFAEWPASIYLGQTNPGIEVGDRVKFSLEKVK